MKKISYFYIQLLLLTKNYKRAKDKKKKKLSSSEKLSKWMAKFMLYDIKNNNNNFVQCRIRQIKYYKCV